MLHPPLKKIPLFQVSVWLPMLVILTISACYFMIFRDLVFVCDDLIYSHTMQSLNAGWKAYPIMMHLHWEEHYSRMAEMIAPAFMEYLPATPRAIFMAIFTGLFFWFALLFCRFRVSKTFWRLMLILLMAFTLRWDGLWTEYIAFVNNVWASAFALGGLLLIFKGNPENDSGWLWLLMPPVIAAGWMHEACGVPLAIGLACMFFANRPYFARLSHAKKALAASFMLGAFLTLTSPASYGRIMAEHEPYADIIFGSLYWPLILIAVTAILFFMRREFITRLLRTPWILFAVAGTVGCAFPLAAGFGGRPAWFCQLFSLLALAIMVAEGGLRIPRPANLILSPLFAALVIMHYIGLERWQTVLTAQTRDVVELLGRSRDGVIFYDYIREPDLPWWTMRKLHAVPDEDDTGYRLKMGLFYANANTPVILPTAAASLPYASMSHPVKIGDSYISPFSFNFPVTDIWTVCGHHRVLLIGGEKMIEIPFSRAGRHFWFYTPLDFDRGEK